MMNPDLQQAGSQSVSSKSLRQKRKTLTALTDPNQMNHRVKVNLGYTRNMGNFESLRLDIGLEVDGIGKPSDTFEQAWKWTEAKLVEKMKEVEETLGD
jgi:hypothetical protein